MSLDIAVDRQSLPDRNENTPIVRLVTRDLEKRAAFGEKKYGDKLRGFNGRDALMDAYQEVLDLAMYMRQALFERKQLEQENMGLKIENEALRKALSAQIDDLK